MKGTHNWVNFVKATTSMYDLFRLLVCDSNTDVRDTLKELVLPLAGDLLPGLCQINQESFMVHCRPSWYLGWRGEHCCPYHAHPLATSCSPIITRWIAHPHSQAETADRSGRGATKGAEKKTLVFQSLYFCKERCHPVTLVASGFLTFFLNICS